MSAAQDSGEILFVCGFPSSGTDLLKNILNAHQSIHIGGEFPLLPMLAEKYGPDVPQHLVDQAAKDINRCDIYGNLTHRELSREFSGPYAFGKIYSTLLTDGEYVLYGNKTPQNSEHVGELEQLFPGAYYILIVRDVRDVALSWNNKWGKDPIFCAHKWAVRMKSATNKLRSLAQDRHIVVRFEDLLADQRAVMSSICQVIGVPYDSRIEEFHKHVESIVPGKLNYGRPVLSDNKEKWRDSMDPETTERIEEIGYEMLLEFGYPISTAGQHVGIRASERLRGRIRDIYAEVFVGNRALGRGKFANFRQSVALELSKRSRYLRFRR